MADISFTTDSEVTNQATIPEQEKRVLLDLDWLQQNIRCQHRCPAHVITMKRVLWKPNEEVNKMLNENDE